MSWDSLSIAGLIIFGMVVLLFLFCTLKGCNRPQR